MREKLHELKCQQTVRPFIIVNSIFFFGIFTGNAAMAPYIVQIFHAYSSPLAPDRTAAIYSFVSNLGILLFLILLRFTGKRRLYLIMLGCIVVLTAIISGYGFILLPSGYNSFDQTNYFAMDNQKPLTYIPVACLILMNFCTYCSVYSMGWQMISEVFPNK